MIFLKNKNNWLLFAIFSVLGVSVLVTAMSEQGGDIQDLESDINESNTELSRLISQNILPLKLNYLPNDFMEHEKKNPRSIGDYFLEKAIRAENLKAVRILLEAGIDPRVIFYDRVEGGPSSLLHVAVRTGNIPIVQELLKHGANINSNIAPYGNTSLLVAIEEDDAKMVKQLIQSGANVNYRSETAPSEEDATPLNLAIARSDMDNDEIIKLLLRAGADISSIQDEDSLNRLVAMNDETDTEMEDVTIGSKRKRGFLESDDPKRRIKRARVDEEVDVMDVSEDTSDDDTTLRALNQQGIIPVKEKLEISKIGPSEIGGYILYKAVKEDNKDAVSILLDEGVSYTSVFFDSDHDRRELNGEDCTGRILWPLTRAVKDGNLSMVDLLLKKGADPDNDSVHPDDTPLKTAVVYVDRANESEIKTSNRLKIIQRLIDSGADVNIRSDCETEPDYCSPLNSAIYTHNLNDEVDRLVLMKFIDAGADLQRPLFDFLRDSYLSELKVLIHFGVDLNSPNENGAFPLIVAAKENQNEVVKLLLSRGAIPPTEQEMVAHGLSEESKALIRNNKHLYYEYTDAVEGYLDETIAHQDIHNEVFEGLLGKKEAENIRKRKEWIKQFKHRFPGLENMLEKISSEEQMSAFIEAFGRTVRKMKQQQK